MRKINYKVSVLMTVFNAENQLSNSIASILEQTYNDLEFIIVDDGSTDNSKKIIVEYANKDSRIIFINRQENKGRVYSLNEGLKYCSTNFLFINDADDISLENRIERQMNFYNNLKNKYSFGVIGCASRTINTVECSKSDYKITFGSIRKKVIPKWRLYIGMPFIHSSFLYNLEKLKKIGGFATEVSSLIDYLTLNKIAVSSKIYGINEILVERYVDGNNFFMKSGVLSKRKENIEYIRRWQKENYNLFWLYEIINKIKIFMKGRDL